MKMRVKLKHQSLMSNFVNVWNNCIHNVMLNVNNYVKNKAKFAQYNQVFIQLQSSYDSKNQLLKELIAEIGELGVRADEGAEERARNRRDELYQQLSTSRQRLLCEKQ